jgi:hypothetical protein
MEFKATVMKNSVPLAFLAVSLRACLKRDVFTPDWSKHRQPFYIHQTTIMRLYRSLCLTTALLALAVAGPHLHAGETTGNPTGTWKVTITHDGKNDAYQPVLKLKSADHQLTGTLTRNTGTKIETLPITDGKLTGNELSFNVHFFSQVYQDGVLQPANTNRMSHWKFQGTLTGDSIKGTVEKKSSASTRIQNWEAKRAAE